MKSLMGTSSGSRSVMQGLASKYTNGDLDSFVNSTNGFFVSVCEDLPRLHHLTQYLKPTSHCQLSSLST